MNKVLAGRYELIERIGEGGMAVVYKAKDRLLNRYIAVKILRPEYTKDKKFVQSFKRESQAAAGLQNQNIVGVYDVGKEGNINFIVMELIDGDTLSNIIEKKAPLDYQVAVDITKQVAQALSVAHKHSIIHRDIKPHNIMITKDGVAKLADFGIAKAVSSSTIVADTSKVIGSVHYFSPEQARGSYVDERSDIYSLGIVLYEMLTGRVPFDGENPVQVALMHINENIKPPSEIVAGIPPTLERIVLKATDRIPENRYKSTEEMLKDLEGVEFMSNMMNGNHTDINRGVWAAPVPERRNSSSNTDYDDVPEKKKKKKKKKSRKKGWIIAGSIALGCLLIIGILIAFGVIGSKAQVEVPDLTGMTYNEAKMTLEQKDLKIERGEDVPSSKYEKGRVVSQLPLSGTKVKKGKYITVNISEGQKKGKVPSLINMKYTSRAEIDDYLESYGYSLGEVTERESDAEEGTIISQTPSAGRKAKRGSTVDIVVSKGKENPTVPSITGMTLDEAKNVLSGAGFGLGNVSYRESNIYSDGYIMEQQYSPGTKLEKGKSISVVVAKQKQEPVEPETPDPNNPGEQSGQGE